MTKISPLGVISIAFFVKRWNDSNDTQRKQKVQLLLYSNDEIDINEALHDISVIAETEISQARKNNFYVDTNVNRFICETAHLIGFCLFGPVDVSRKERQEIQDQSKKEVASYFTSMFQAGHFEQIPVPEFCIYGMSDEEVKRHVLTGNEVRFRQPELVVEGKTHQPKLGVDASNEALKRFKNLLDSPQSGQSEQAGGNNDPSKLGVSTPLAEPEDSTEDEDGLG